MLGDVVKKILFVVGAVGPAIGCILFYDAYLSQSQAPQLKVAAESALDKAQYQYQEGEKILAQAPQLKIVAELDKTQYQVGEKILVRPLLINTGEQPVTIFGTHPLLFFRVYDADKRAVGEKDVLDLLPFGGLAATANPIIRQDILRTLSLSPGAAHVETWPEGYTFTLDQPGSYKVVAWAEFSLDQRPYYAANPLHIAAEPLWIEVVAR